MTPQENRIAIYTSPLVFLFLEIAVLDRFRFMGTRPELLLIATLFFGFHFGIARGIEVGLISGILKDIFSVNGFGVNTFSFLGIGFFSGYLKDKLFKENFVIQFLFACFSVWVVSAVYFIIMGTKLSLARELLTAVLYKSLYTGILAPISFSLFSKIFKLPKT